MAVEKLTLSGIYDIYKEDHFYIAHFSAPLDVTDHQIYSDRPPYKARIKINRFEMFNNISVCSKYGEERRSDFFVYMVSDNLEELTAFYKKEKKKWIHGQVQYHNDQIHALKKAEKELEEL